MDDLLFYDLGGIGDAPADQVTRETCQPPGRLLFQQDLVLNESALTVDPDQQPFGNEDLDSFTNGAPADIEAVAQV